MTNVWSCTACKGNIASLSRVKIPPFLMVFSEYRLSWSMTEAVNDTTSFENGRTSHFSSVFIRVTFLCPPSLAQNDLRCIHHDLHSLSINRTTGLERRVVSRWPLDWAICKVIGKEKPSIFAVKLASTIVFITTCLNSFLYPIKGMPWIRSYYLSIQKREEIAYFALRITNDQILFVVQSTVKVPVQPTTDIHQIDLWRRQRTKSSLLHMVRRLFSLSLFLTHSLSRSSLSLSLSGYQRIFCFFFPSQSIVWNVIMNRSRQYTSDWLFSSLQAKMSSTHFIYFTYTTNSRSPSALMYIYTTADPIHVYSCTYISRERERKRERETREFRWGKFFFGVKREEKRRKKRRWCALVFLCFLIDKMYKHNEHAHLCATNDAKLLNHLCRHICIDFASD